MRAKRLVGVWVLAVVGACGGNTGNSAGTSAGDGGDGNGGAPDRGEAGADAATGGSEPTDGGTSNSSGAAGAPSTDGTGSPGSGGVVGDCVPGTMNTCVCADGTTSFHYCGVDGEWDDCICGIGIGGTTNAGGTGGVTRACTPGNTQRCTCPDGSVTLQLCTADATWQPCFCPGTGSGGMSGAGGAALVCTPGEVRRCQATCGTGIWTCNATGTGFGECVCPGTGGASGAGGNSPDGGSAGSAGNAGTTADGGSAGECAGTVCGTECVDLNTDVNHCGECDAECTGAPLPSAETVACRDGVCVVASCPPGFDDCDADPTNGCEVGLTSNVEHCGACGQQCAELPHVGTTSCVAGRCAIVCELGWADCDADPSNGCEVDVENDPANCGACAVDCMAVANASESSCVAGLCEINSCEAGYDDCNALHADGCEVSLDSDPNNCGECAAVCSDGECIEGHCE